MVRIVERELLTPVGLRTLEPADPDYKPHYQGSPAERDAAYHQGTVWPWLLGPFIDAYLTAFGKSAANLAYCRNLVAKLEAEAAQAGCVGSIAEIYDADEPRYPRGCPAQAWSVAEIARLKVGLRLGFLIPAPEAFGRPGRLCQYVLLQCARRRICTFRRCPGRAAMRALEMFSKWSNSRSIYLEELDLYIPVHGAFQRHCEGARLFPQCERLHGLRQMHQEPFSRRVGAAEGHEASMSRLRSADRY